MRQARIKFTSKELVHNFSELGDLAVREPIVITKRGGGRLVLVSIETFYQLTRACDDPVDQRDRFSERGELGAGAG